MLFKPSHVWISRKTFRCGQQTKATPGSPALLEVCDFPGGASCLLCSCEKQYARQCLCLSGHLISWIGLRLLVQLKMKPPPCFPLSWLSAGVITRLSAGDSQHHAEFWEGTRGRRGALVVEGLERGSDEWDRPQLSAGSGMIWQRLCVADCPSLSWAYKQPMDCKSFWMSDQKLAFSSLSFRRSACLGTGVCGAGRVNGQKHENAQETSGVGRAFYFYLVNSELF